MQYAVHIITTTFRADHTPGIFPESISAAGYTHIYAASAYIDPGTYQLAFTRQDDAYIWERLTALRQTNPGLQIWLSVGGWYMNTPGQPTEFTWSNVVASSANDATFFTSLVGMLGAYGFDGVDIDWRWPGSSTRSTNAADGHNYAASIQSLRAQLDATGYAYGLSVTLPGSSKYLSYHDLESLRHSVDWFNVLSYNIHVGERFLICTLVLDANVTRTILSPVP